MKKNFTDLLYREMTGSGNSGIVDQVALLLQRRLDGKKLSKQEESVLAETEKSLAGILGDGGKGGYRPEKVIISDSSEAPPPLPFSSFAEGLARLQMRIGQRAKKPKLRTVPKISAYRPDSGAKSAPADDAKIAAIVQMARVGRKALAKSRRKSSKSA